MWPLSSVENRAFFWQHSTLDEKAFVAETSIGIGLLAKFNLEILFGINSEKYPDLPKIFNINTIVAIIVFVVAISLINDIGYRYSRQGVDDDILPILELD